MTFDQIYVPASVVGTVKRLAAILIPGAGPSGADVLAEVDAALPVNSVGGNLVEVDLGTDVPLVITEVWGHRIALDFVYICVGATSVAITIQDASGKKVLDEHVLTPRSALMMPMRALPMNGLSWMSSGAGATGGIRAFKL